VCPGGHLSLTSDFLVAKVARALAIHNVDEIVIYEDRSSAHNGQQKINPNLFLARVFQHMETPQYMRKTLVPFHEDLKAAGNPLSSACTKPQPTENLFYI
jgi:predicted SPOUT superfamily RNA methylase MTH1